GCRESFKPGCPRPMGLLPWRYPSVDCVVSNMILHVNGCDVIVQKKVIKPGLMNTLVKQSVSYLAELGLPATPVRFIRPRGLPYFLSDTLDLASVTLAEQVLVLAIDQEAGRSPA